MTIKTTTSVSLPIKGLTVGEVIDALRDMPATAAVGVDVYRADRPYETDTYAITASYTKED